MPGGEAPGEASRAPQPGDVTICMGCAGVLVFQVDGTLERVTAETIAELDPEQTAALADFRCAMATQARREGRTLLGFDGPLVLVPDQRRREQLD